MNLQNLLAQMGTATNPMALMMSMLNPNQKQLANQFQNKSKEEQAKKIAEICNQNNISKEQLQDIICLIKGTRQ